MPSQLEPYLDQIRKRPFMVFICLSVDLFLCLPVCLPVILLFVCLLGLCFLVYLVLSCLSVSLVYLSLLSTCVSLVYLCLSCLSVSLLSICLSCLSVPFAIPLNVVCG
jgi:hypothetical protein